MGSRGKVANAYPSVAGVFRPQRERHELNRVDIDKQKQLNQVAIAREKALAALTGENPTYAAYLVNRELASKVEIAVLPLGNGIGRARQHAPDHP